MPLAWPGRLTILLLAVAPCLLLIAAADRVGGEHHRAHRHHVVLSPLQILNPWLSACDVAHPASAPDLQGPCSSASPGKTHTLRNTRSFDVKKRAALTLPSSSGSPSTSTSTTPATEREPAEAETSPPSCPSSCVAHGAGVTLKNQCLSYLSESHKDSVCQPGSGQILATLRLKHCCEHTALSALHPEALQSVLKGGQSCHMFLKAMLELDALAARLSCEFGELLTRFDCDHPYSMPFGCADCQEAYRQWVCASLVPHFPHAGGSRQRPCRSICQNVEQRCPFFLPGDRWPNLATQYAGEPTFLCIDANVPETEAQRNKSLYGDVDCCYNHCDTPIEGICAATNCVDRSGVGDGDVPPAEHCAPLAVSVPSPTDRTAPSSTCVATSGGPAPPAKNSSSICGAFFIVVLVCNVAVQVGLLQRFALMAWRGLTLSWGLLTGAWIIVRTLRKMAQPVTVCQTFRRACAFMLMIVKQESLAFISLYYQSASEITDKSGTSRGDESFCRHLLKLFIKSVLGIKRTTRIVTLNLLRTEYIGDLV